MNRNFALAVVIAAAATGNAFAESPTIDTTPFKSTASRAEVRAELATFVAAGGVTPRGEGYAQMAPFTSSKTRAQVTAELMATPRSELAAYHGEDGGSSYMARSAVRGDGMTRLAQSRMAR